MPLHLIKLCVGCGSVKDLERWIRQKLKAKKGSRREHIHITRMAPKRADQLLAGGSLYWVIRGQIMCRQRLIDIRSCVDSEGMSRCQLVLEPKLVLVEPRPCRAFQGWRYLEDKNAPRDLDQVAPGVPDMPEQLRRELRELGLL